MPRPEYVPIDCKAAVNKVQGMPFKWSLNSYTGCSHACQYCYARSYYVTADHGDAATDFQTRIFVKRNIATVLRQQLSRPSWHGELIALGTATDCYQPAEGRFRVTRACLETLLEYANPMSIVTKSPMIIRDVDVLSELAKLAQVKVLFTITTVDLDLWRKLEPGTASPFHRLRAMQLLNEQGVTAGVLMAPILPGLTDSAESLRAVAEAAADHKAAFFGSAPLRLMPTVKEHYLGFVEREYPELLERYTAAYAGRVHPPKAYEEALDLRIKAATKPALRRLKPRTLTPRPSEERLGLQYTLQM